MDESSTRRFYDEPAADYDLLYADWDASVAAQGAALDGLISDALGREAGAFDVLDCSRGIGTQAIGLAALGHRVTGTDLSPVAAARAAREAVARGLSLTTATADMRALPFRATPSTWSYARTTPFRICSPRTMCSPRRGRCGACCGPADCCCSAPGRTTGSAGKSRRPHPRRSGRVRRAV